MHLPPPAPDAGVPPGGTSARFWLNLQAQYDLDVHSDLLGDRLEREVVQHAG